MVVVWPEQIDAVLRSVMCRCISPGSVKLGTFTAYIPVEPVDGSGSDGDPPAADASASADRTDATQPNNPDEEMASGRLNELREGCLLYTSPSPRD